MISIRDCRVTNNESVKQGTQPQSASRSRQVTDEKYRSISTNKKQETGVQWKWLFHFIRHHDYRVPLHLPATSSGVIIVLVESYLGCWRSVFCIVTSHNILNVLLKRHWEYTMRFESSCTSVISIIFCAKEMCTEEASAKCTGDTKMISTPAA